MPTLLWTQKGGAHLEWLLECVEKSGSGAKSDEQLDIRSRLHGDRVQLLRSIGVFFGGVAAVDLRDNRIRDEEVATIADALERDKLKLSKLVLAGNRIGSNGVHALSTVLTVSELLVDGSIKFRHGSLTDVDLSRNAVCRKTTTDAASGVSETYDGIEELARATAQSSRISALALSRCALSDAAGEAFLVKLCDTAAKPLAPVAPGAAAPGAVVGAVGKPAKAPPGPPPMALMRLDLSGNQLRAQFGAKLGAAFAVCPALIHLNLRGNGLGAAGGKAIASALIKSNSLRSLDLSCNNLCDCNPKYAASAQPIWCGDAIEALADALLSGANLQSVDLTENELTGQWSERLGGDWAKQGTYTTQAIDALIAALEKERLQLKKRGGLVVDGNHLLKCARPCPDCTPHPYPCFCITANERSLASRRHDWIRLDKALLENEKKPKRTSGTVGGAGSKSKSDAGAKAANRSSSAVQAPRRRASVVSTAVSSGFTPRGELDGLAGDALQPQPDGSNPQAAEDLVASAQSVAPAVAPPPEVEVGDGATVDAKDRDSPAADSENALAAADHASAAAVGEPSPVQQSVMVAAAAPASATPTPVAAAPKAVAQGKSPGNRKSKEGASPDGKKVSPTKAATAKAASSGDKAAPPGDGTATSSSGSPDRSRTTYRQAKSGDKKKKEKAEVVVEVDPYAGLPLYIARTQLAVRKARETDSEILKDVHKKDLKLGSGSLMRVVDEFEIVEGITKLMTKRMHVILDGDSEPVGWVTGLTRDGTENLRLASAGFPLRRAIKPLVCREGKETNSKKLDDIPRHTLLRVLEEATMPDGSVRAKLAKGDVTCVEEIGWITLSKPGEDEPKLEDPPVLSDTFDLKAHTAASLSKALKTKQGKNKAALQGVRKKKGGEGGLPWQAAGRGPAVRTPDDGMPSRHACVTEPAKMVLMFNCFGAAFEVTSWTGSMPFVLPDEQSFDLYPARKGSDAPKGEARAKLGRVGLARELRAPFLDRIEFPDQWVLANENGLVHDGWQGPGTLDLELTCGKDVATIQVTPWLAYSCSVGARVNIRSIGSTVGQCATVDRILGDDRIVAKVDGFARTEGVKGEVIVDLTPKAVVPTEGGPGYTRGQRLFVLNKASNALVDAVVMNWEGSVDVQQGSRHMVLVKEAGAKTGLHSWPTLNVFNHVAAPAGLTAAQFEGVRARYCAHIASTQDTVEDAITGNSLPIEVRFSPRTHQATGHAAAVARSCCPQLSRFA